MKRSEKVFEEAKALKDCLLSYRCDVSAMELSPLGIAQYGKLSAILLFFDNIEGTDYHVTMLEDLIKDLKNEIKDIKSEKKRA